MNLFVGCLTKRQKATSNSPSLTQINIYEIPRFADTAFSFRLLIIFLFLYYDMLSRPEEIRTHVMLYVAKYVGEKSEKRL